MGKQMRVFLISFVFTTVTSTSKCTDIKKAYRAATCCTDGSKDFMLNNDAKLLIREAGGGPRLWVPGKAVLFSWGDPFGSGAYLNFIGKNDNYEWFYGLYDAPLPTAWYSGGFEKAGTAGVTNGTVVNPPEDKVTGHMTWVNTVDYSTQYYVMINGWVPPVGCFPDHPSKLNLAATTPMCMPVSDGNTSGWLFGGPAWDYGPLIMRQAVSATQLVKTLLHVY